MRHIIPLCACCLFACTSPQAPAPTGIDAPREISLAESSRCREVGLVVKRSVRHSTDAFNTEQAMRDALAAVLAAGADTYRLLDVDTEGRGTQVIMQAFNCP